MALITVSDFTCGAKGGFPDGSILVMFEEPDGTQYMFPFAKEASIEFADRIKQTALNLKVARADEMPKGGPDGSASTPTGE